MKYRDLRDFLDQLEARGQLRRITTEIDPRLEMTEICDRTLRTGGPALLFENPKGHSIPVLGNLFGTPERVALGMGEESVGALREVGLPDGEIPMALFSFNVGIELGQLAFVLALVALAPLVRRLPVPVPQRIAVYAMGSLAAFWMIERGAAVLGA